MKRLLQNKKYNILLLGIFLAIIFAQALVIGKLYLEKDDKNYVVNLVKINTEKDSIDYLKIKNDLNNVDKAAEKISRFLKAKNITSESIEKLKEDSLTNSIYVAKVSNRYSQYLVDLQKKLQQIPLGIPSDGYISSSFGKRKNPIPVKATPQKTTTITTPQPVTEEKPEPKIVQIKDSLGNVIKEITVYPKTKAVAKNAGISTVKAAKNSVNEENTAPAEADQIQFHKGIDVAVPFGSDVRATASGIVLFAGKKGGYGNCVIISHENGLATLYAHLSELLVKENEEVAVNQVIARSGNSGRSTAPHLHYEVHKNNTPVNPKLFLNF